MAMVMGIEAYGEILDAFSQLREDIDFDTYKVGLSQLDALVAGYFHAVVEIDRELWPKVPLRPPGAVFAFTRGGTRQRWYLHVPHAGILLPCRDPVQSELVRKQTQQIIAYAGEHEDELFTGDRRWVTVAVEGVTVTPTSGSPLPESAIMDVGLMTDATKLDLANSAGGIDEHRPDVAADGEES